MECSGLGSEIVLEVHRNKGGNQLHTQRINDFIPEGKKKIRLRYIEPDMIIILKW